MPQAFWHESARALLYALLGKDRKHDGLCSREIVNRSTPTSTMFAQQEGKHTFEEVIRLVRFKSATIPAYLNEQSIIRFTKSTPCIGPTPANREPRKLLGA